MYKSLADSVELEKQQSLFDSLQPGIDLTLCHACLMLFCLNSACILFCSLLMLLVMPEPSLVKFYHLSEMHIAWLSIIS